MLVLSRKVDESIIIGGVIKITVIKVEKGESRIKLGIEAPKEIIVQREEIAR